MHVDLPCDFCVTRIGGTDVMNQQIKEKKRKEKEKKRKEKVKKRRERKEEKKEKKRKEKPIIFYLKLQQKYLLAVAVNSVSTPVRQAVYRNCNLIRTAQGSI